MQAEGENFMNQEKIGKFIAEKRKEKKLTQAELAEKLGVSDRSISNWENGKNMPDLSLFKPLCDELDISLNDFLSGEVVKEKEYFTKLEENIINTIDYSNKKIEKKNNLIGLILIIFGVLILITAIAIFPSESSWGSIYSMFGVIVFLLGFNKFIKHLTLLKRLLCNFGYFLACMAILLLVDYIGVVNIHEAPRFSITKTYYNNIMYYDTLFYDVVRCNLGDDNETFKVIKNQKYDLEKMEELCK
jgi:transcriptional regulator with XRE-family HTH domain